MSDAPAAPAADAAKAKKKSPLMLIVAVVVLLGGGGGGYWWWSHRAGAAEGAEAEEHEEPKGDPGVISFEPFVANLADAGGTRFVRVAVKLVVDSAEHATEIEANPVVLAQARSAILEALTERTADELVTPDGKAALKADITEHTSHLFHETKVTDVLFTEFVVQF